MASKPERPGAPVSKTRRNPDPLRQHEALCGACIKGIYYCGAGTRLCAKAHGLQMQNGVLQKKSRPERPGSYGEGFGESPTNGDADGPQA